MLEGRFFVQMSAPNAPATAVEQGVIVEKVGPETYLIASFHLPYMSVLSGAALNGCQIFDSAVKMRDWIEAQLPVLDEEPTRAAT